MAADNLRTGIANLPLHYGKAPRWLFSRMVKLAREITIVIVSEFGPEEMLKKLSNPFWFQAFGCVLGFDWHSSGLTTTVCGALKEGIKDISLDLELMVAGGKGAASRKTPDEILKTGDTFKIEPSPLIYASRMAAKVDNNALQDGYQLYHHCFIFTNSGSWAVIQQGMNESTHYARRYHWLGEGVKDFVCEPHAAICCDQKKPVFNMVAQESRIARETVTALSREKPDTLVRELKKIQTLSLPPRHEIQGGDINPDRVGQVLLKTHDRQPEEFSVLLGMPGVGAKTIRALSLIAELVYGVKPSFRDPARYSFAHGGKDGHPYPVDRKIYDRSIEVLQKAISQSKVGRTEKMEAVKRLAHYARCS
ncbi:MAG: DUF763 domain-containing protein [Thermodesulfobacteriota bacterium]|nr:DUF763 domain-containing protein [Thermodesulfobacteriota bacterium]